MRIRRFNERVSVGDDRRNALVKDIFQNIEDEYLDYKVTYSTSPSQSRIHIERKMNRLDIRQTTMKSVDAVNKYVDSLKGIVSLVEEINSNIDMIMSSKEFDGFSLTHEQYNNYSLYFYHSNDEITIGDIFDIRGAKVDIHESLIRKYFYQCYKNEVSISDIELVNNWNQQGIDVLQIKLNNVTPEKITHIEEDFAYIKYEETPGVTSDVFSEVYTEHYNGGVTVTNFRFESGVEPKMIHF